MERRIERAAGTVGDRLTERPISPTLPFGPLAERTTVRKHHRVPRTRRPKPLASLACVMLLSACATPETPLRRFVENSDDQPRSEIPGAEGDTAAVCLIRGVLYEFDGVRIEAHVHNSSDSPLHVDASRWFLLVDDLEYAPTKVDGPKTSQLAPGEGGTWLLDYSLSRPMTVHGHLLVHGLGDPDGSSGPAALDVPPRPPIADTRKIRLYPGS